MITDNNTEVEAQNSESDMSVDEDGSWKEQRKARKKKQGSTNYQNTSQQKYENHVKSVGAGAEIRKHMEKGHNQMNQSCEKGDKQGKTEEEINPHKKKKHDDENTYSCEKCGEQYKTEEDVKVHKNNVHGNKAATFNCEKCTAVFITVSDLRNHMKYHRNDEIIEDFPCQKCTKIYLTMSKLRRHDWRNHREIMCNSCGDNLPSRQELKEHRASKHQMMKKVYCRYFPNCLDEDECLYVHEKIEESKTSGCVDGSYVVISLARSLTKSTWKTKLCADSSKIVID